MLKEFREFINRGNVIDLAVAVAIGAAFGKIITTLVDGVVMPPIGLLLGGLDFSSFLYVLNGARNDPPVRSLAEAKARGVPVIAFGQLINDVINFLIIAFVIFLVVKAYNRAKSKQATDAAPTIKDCPYCLTSIPLKATRCSACCADMRAA
ncbi:MAG: large conductance mechanosensitive channel protein MscL [Pyrinomonadaceae bacterium]